GKRKKSSRKPQGKKKKDPLPSTFPCLFCNHESSVSTKLDRKAGTGELSCKACGQQFQTAVNYLSSGVDVYSDWIDACDAVAKEAAYAPGDPERATDYHGHAVLPGSSKHGNLQGGRQMSAIGEGQDDDMGEYGEDDT
ncbi:MAG: hypothetical protein Q9200_006860, partial [Gallowayella weberi]